MDPLAKTVKCFFGGKHSKGQLIEDSTGEGGRKGVGRGVGFKKVSGSMRPCGCTHVRLGINTFDFWIY